ncbi:MAG: undecaprenyldiphospho-muramoylpentapeptide beta-N-acetylglucosaminyltransferase [Acidobacteria bacterium]|nr:undecaprenyldiphospho-muramoylpentapeptide beta-N-acetylglucosaminyltransferase [Acidobacteriota bacterium]MBI3280648.1 undecaprenyldiphospho-muramoylpentapeptide beta-N-acetylglucosaminyltransferase [Acidobacteriota bacterium]
MAKLVIAMAGGGTGGHILPALAVAAELRRRGHHPFFIGTPRGMEARLVPRAGYEVEWIEIGPLNRVGIRQRMRTLLQLPAGVRRATRILRARGASAVFSTGGYVAGPVMLAARLARIPLVIMEPNAVPGFANRRAARLVQRALVNFPETARYFPKRTEVTGVPVREEFFRIEPRPASARPLHVLITGGSQGSQRLNEAARACWPLLADSDLAVHLTLQTGYAMYAALVEEFSRSGLPGVVTPFIGDMAPALAEADLIVCRAGASTVSELAAAGRPSVLVPFPFAADDHQARNAEVFARAGAARLVPDQEMDGRRLFAEIQSLAGAPEELRRMAAAARTLASPGAAQRAAEVLEELAGA